MIRNIRLRLIYLVCMLLPCLLLAGHGYCWKCGCNAFDKDIWRSNNTWYCKCGHEYDHHYHGDRPVSFGGHFNTDQSTPCKKKKDFFDDGMNVLLSIAAGIVILAIIITRNPAVIAGGGVIIYMFIRALINS